MKKPREGSLQYLLIVSLVRFDLDSDGLLTVDLLLLSNITFVCDVKVKELYRFAGIFNFHGVTDVRVLLVQYLMELCCRFHTFETCVVIIDVSHIRAPKHLSLM